MTDYSALISQIQNADSTAAIEQAVSSFSASAVGAGGILYSGEVGGARARGIAMNIVDANAANAANGVTVNIIDNTPRGLLLADSFVENAIVTAAQRIYPSQGMTPLAANAAAKNLLYGSLTVAAGAEGSVANSLWGQASNAFASSLSGNITVIGTAEQANPLRTFASVEPPALLNNPNVECE